MGWSRASRACWPIPTSARHVLATLVSFLQANAAQGPRHRLRGGAQRRAPEFSDVPAGAARGLRAATDGCSRSPPRSTIPSGRTQLRRDATDYQILMAYDEHFEEGEPGAIASQSWFVDKLTRRMKELDPAKTIIAIGNYGYDWTDNKPPALDMTFQETVLTSKESEALDRLRSASAQSALRLRGGRRQRASRLVPRCRDGAQSDARRRRVSPGGYALWRLGSEDPSIWSLFGRAYNCAIPADSLKHDRSGQRHRHRGPGRDPQYRGRARERRAHLRDRRHAID